MRNIIFSITHSRSVAHSRRQISFMGCKGQFCTAGETRGWEEAKRCKAKCLLWLSPGAMTSDDLSICVPAFILRFSRPRALLAFLCQITV